MHQEFLTICHRAGWKCTPQRLSVYNAVRDNLQHPAVDLIWHEVRQYLPGITRESVYRILNEFAEFGLVNRLDHIEHARYDCRTEPHGHFICEKCGAIADFAIPAAALPAAAAVAGEIRQIELRVTGICDSCRAAASANQPKEERP